MSAQPRTSDELADMITTWLNVTGVKVGVEPDPVDGWDPVIVAARPPIGTSSLPTKSPASCDWSTTCTADFAASHDARGARTASLRGNVCLKAQDNC